MQTAADILSNINISFLLIAILALVVIILFVHSCYMRRNLHECHRVIVRLLNEKEDLRQHLPTELRFKYYPGHLSRPEIISIINMVKKLLLVFCIAGYLLPLNAQKSEPRFSLSANLLSWATLAPNVGAEFYIGKNWSVAADGSFGMWGYSHTQKATQTWNAGGEVRYWLQTGDYGFRRTHIGLSVRGGEFDSNFFGNGGRRGEALLAGITVGYRFVLRGNWYVDAGLGLGYIHTRYDRYFWNKRFDKYEFQGERTCNLFGLTDLYVSLVYRIPTKNR